MKILIPANRKQEFQVLVREYHGLTQELEQEPDNVRRDEIINQIVDISKKFENGLLDVTGFETTESTFDNSQE